MSSRGAMDAREPGAARAAKIVKPPDPHVSGARPPELPAELVPRHVALVMDGNGRWAKERGLPRTEGHKAGEYSLFDVIMGAIELGIPYLSAYAFSTENWRRSPDEVRFLMGFNRDVIRRRRDQLNEMGVRVRWAGRRPRLWRSVISELEDAEAMTEGNSVLTLQFCVNYGGRAEIADAAAAIAADVAAGKLRADKIDEKVFARYLDEPRRAPLLERLLPRKIEEVGPGCLRNELDSHLPPLDRIDRGRPDLSPGTLVVTAAPTPAFTPC